MTRLLLTVILLFPLLLLAGESRLDLKNQLANHPSSYLAMHGNDPVHWQVWGPAVLERAQQTGKLIYISSGYFSCHWCHVMQRESYHNQNIAALLNQYFIPVKVDRELLPALDAHLIDFVSRVRGQAGWPLNVFLTPDGYPLTGLTYVPADVFRQALRRIEKAWRQDATTLAQMARRASEEFQITTLPPLPETIDKQALKTNLRATALALGDEMEGGFGRQSRFPMAPQWTVLLDSLQRSPDPQVKELIERSLDQMAKRGMRDHIGGGFFRYTIDPSWQVPHFEKMLYTQAQLSQLYLKAAVILNRPDYFDVVRDTLDFCLRVMRDERGGFIASLSAIDPQNVEGGAYLWSDAQLKQSLNEQERHFARLRWGMDTRAEQWQGYLPVDEHSLKWIAKKQSRLLANVQLLENKVRDKLLHARSSRSHPKDSKLLAAWNGLMLSALLDAAKQLNEPRYYQAAKELKNYLLENLWDGNQLYRAHDGKQRQGQSSLKDYAYVATALYQWSQYTKSKRDQVLATQLLSLAWQRFYVKGGWQSTDKLLIPDLARSPAMADDALPSASAMLIELSFKVGNQAQRMQARQALGYSYTIALEQPVWYASHLAVLLAHSK